VTTDPRITEWLERIDIVEARLQAQASEAGGATPADPDSGEIWERGQLWGHIAEFVPFWSEQVTDVIDEYRDEPIGFGRSPDRSERKAGIDAGLVVSIDVLWDEVRSDLSDLRHILQALPEGWDLAVGRDGSGNEMTAPTIIERRLVAHLEEHVAQLETVS